MGTETSAPRRDYRGGHFWDIGSYSELPVKYFNNNVKMSQSQVLTNTGGPPMSFSHLVPL